MMDNELTQEEVIEKFGDVKMKFDHYYKYTFYFIGEKDGYVFEGSFGGDSGEIYRSEVSANDFICVGDFEDSCNHFTVSDKKRTTLFEYTGSSYEG